MREASRLAESAVKARRTSSAPAEDLRARVPGAAARSRGRTSCGTWCAGGTAIIKYVEFRFRPQVQVGDAAVRAKSGDREYGASRRRAPAGNGGGRDPPPAARGPRDRREDRGRIKELRLGAEIRYNP